MKPETLSPYDSQEGRELRIDHGKFRFMAYYAILQHLLTSDLTLRPEVVIERRVRQNDRISLKRSVITPKTFAMVRYSYDNDKKQRFLEHNALGMFDADCVVVRYRNLPQKQPVEIPQQRLPDSPPGVFEKYISEELSIDLE